MKVTIHRVVSFHGAVPYFSTKQHQKHGVLVYPASMTILVTCSALNFHPLLGWSTEGYLPFSHNTSIFMMINKVMRHQFPLLSHEAFNTSLTASNILVLISIAHIELLQDINNVTETKDFLCDRTDENRCIWFWPGLCWPGRIYAGHCRPNLPAFWRRGHSKNWWKGTWRECRKKTYWKAYLDWRFPQMGVPP